MLRSEKNGDRPGVTKWEPAKFLHRDSYCKKMCLNFDETYKAMQSGLDVRPLTSTEVYKHLADFGISTELGDGNIQECPEAKNRFSSGEAAMWNKPHVICLDEPTNYLDNETLKALIFALKKFRGGVLTISHNAAFVGEVLDTARLPRQSGEFGRRTTRRRECKSRWIQTQTTRTREKKR